MGERGDAAMSEFLTFTAGCWVVLGCLYLLLAVARRAENPHWPLPFAALTFAIAALLRTFA
jgi:hypothetical protein